MIIKNVMCTNMPQVITIGRQLEDNYRQFVFDCSGFGSDIASVTLVHQRKNDIAPYLVTTSNTNTLTWNVSDTDTAYSGYGKAELRVVFADGLAKSAIYSTCVLESITADATIPEPLQSWYDAMIEYIDEHSVSPEEIEQAVADYLEDHPITAPVTSVNSKIGDVVLNASDVGALPDTTVIPSKTSELVNDSGFLTSAPVTSVNGQTGSVTIAVPTKTSDLQNDSGYITSAPVSSVNSKTGAVTLSASDVGAMPSSTQIPSKTSQLQNDSGFLTSAVTSFNGNTGAVTYNAPVTSVNGATGAVSLSIPTKTSQLQNDSGFLTSAPVSSVDGKTGTVTVIPTGGSTGQVLAKASATDRDVEWITPSGGGGNDWTLLHDSTTTEDALLQIAITNISVKEVMVYAIEPAGYQSSVVIYCPMNNNEGNHYDKNYGRPMISLSNAGGSKKYFYVHQRPIVINGFSEVEAYGTNDGGQVNMQIKAGTATLVTAGMAYTSMSVATYQTLPAGIRIVVLGR